MTGDYPSRHAMAVHISPHQRGWERLRPPPSPGALSPRVTSLADILATRGYRSTWIGKWHLGYGNNPHDYQRVDMPEGMGPKTPRVAFGFDPPPGPETPGIKTRYEQKLATFARDNPGKGIGPQTAQAIRFIEQNRSRPFFCLLALNSVHLPVAVRSELATKYRRRVVAHSSILDPVYLGMTEAMDDAVGLVLEALEELGLSERTVVVFGFRQRRSDPGISRHGSGHDAEHSAARSKGDVVGGRNSRAADCPLARSGQSRSYDSRTDSVAGFFSDRGGNRAGPRCRPDIHATVRRWYRS